MGGLQEVTVAIISVALAAGMLVTLLGALPPPDHGRPNQVAARRGWLFHLFLVAAAPLAGYLTAVWTVRGVMLAGAVVAALSLVLLSWYGSMSRGVPALALMAAGTAGLAVGAFAMMPDAFVKNPREMAAAVNMGYVFFLLGVLITPALAAVLTAAVGESKALLVFALLCLVPAGAVLWTPREQFHVPVAEGTPLDALADFHPWLAGAALFLFLPLKGFLREWIATFVPGDPEAADLVPVLPRFVPVLRGLIGVVMPLACLGLGMLGWVDSLSDSLDPWLVFGLAFLTAITLTNLASQPHDRSPFLGFFVLALALGTFVPSVVGLVYSANVFVPAQRGLLFGVMLACGSLGHVMWSPWLRLPADPRARPSLALPVVLAFAMSLVSLILGLL